MADTLLPINATSQERSLEAATARLSDVPVLVRDAWNPDTCPDALLPWLAWQFSVDEWDASWTDAQKRETIRRSVAVHRYKGTIGAVRDALKALAFDARVQEWFNQAPAGTPYTFRLLLEADQIGIGQSGYATLVNVVERTKNLRSHLDEIVPSVRSHAGPYVAACANIGSEIAVTNYQWATAVFNETTICM